MILALVYHVTAMSGTMLRIPQTTYSNVNSLARRKDCLYLKYQLILRLIRILQKVMQLLELDKESEQCSLTLRMVFENFTASGCEDKTLLLYFPLF